MVQQPILRHKMIIEACIDYPELISKHP